MQLYSSWAKDKGTYQHINLLTYQPHSWLGFIIILYRLKRILMKTYIMALLVLITVFNSSTGFSQTSKVKSSPCNTMVSNTKHHKHHGKSVAKHHVVKRAVPRVDETITVDDRSATAIVNIKDGDVYVNDSLVATVKNPKNEDHRIIINYIAPPPPAPVAEIEHVKVNSYTGEMPMKGMLGVRVDDASDGARIEHIIPCSAADQVGLLPGDVITKVDDHNIANSDELLQVLGNYKAGDKVTVTIKDYDGTETHDVQLTKETIGCGCAPCNSCERGRW